MGILTEEMNVSLRGDEACRCAAAALLRGIGHFRRQAQPFSQGSNAVLSDDELGFADLASPGTIENPRHNPATPDKEETPHD